jgi:hypothetical protein
MQAAAAALQQAAEAGAADVELLPLKAVLDKETVAYNKANKGEGTAKGVGWEKNGTSYVKFTQVCLASSIKLSFSNVCTTLWCHPLCL